MRDDDKKKLLMGMAVLKSHDVNGTRYAPDGWLGRPPDNGDNGLILPIEDAAFIDSFSKTFDVQRGDDPGLTIVVPWCDIDLTDENLVRAVLRGYFWPILRGQLEVIVETGSIQTILDASSLENEIRKIGNDLEREILPLVELAKWANSLNASQLRHAVNPGHTVCVAVVKRTFSRGFPERYAQPVRTRRQACDSRSGQRQREEPIATRRFFRRIPLS